MQLGFKEEDIKFRDEVRGFIKETFTDDMRKTLSLSKNGIFSLELIFFPINSAVWGLAPIIVWL